MNRGQLAHVLRAASNIVDDPNILVIGSQALLASFDEERLPDAATASMEVDLAYLDDPEEEKADAIDGAIGEWSMFHETFGFYAQGVSVATAVLPDGWRNRLVHWASRATGSARAAFLEPHDCVISKLVAHRAKDLAFADALIRAGLVDAAVLLERTRQLPVGMDPRLVRSLEDWLARYLPRPPERPGEPDRPG